MNHIELFPYICITTVSLSAKFLCDETVNFFALANLIGISKRQLEKNESYILKTINWNLWKLTKKLI